MTRHFVFCWGVRSLLVAAMGMVPLRPGSAWGAEAESFAGEFANQAMHLTLSESNGAYVGTITLNGNKYPAKAHAAGQGLDGTFTADGADFPFTATLAENRLTLISAGNTFALTRVVRNPLAAGNAAGNGGPANPLGQAAAPAQAPPAAADARPDTIGAFTLLGETATGKTLFLKLPPGQTLESAITQTADEVGKICDGKPTVSGAFGNRNKNMGGATLTATMKGQPMRGTILCGIGASADTGTVILAQADAPQKDLATLFGFLPATLKMQTHTFPDNSGSVDMPPGWTTVDPTAAFGFILRGPEGQVVGVSMIRQIKTPNCSLVRLSQQTYQMARQNYANQLRQYQQMQQMRQRFPNIRPGIPPKEPVAPDPDPNVQFPNIDFCQECSGAEEVLKTWFPIAEAKAKRRGGPYTSMEKIIKVAPGEPNPMIAGSASGVAYFAVTDHDGDKQTPVRVLTWIATAPVVQGEQWQIQQTTLRAPDVIFDRDLPLMKAILDSVNVNMDVVNKKIADNGAAIRQIIADNTQAMLQRGREFQIAQDQRFQSHQAQVAAQQQAVHDSASDFIEYVRGVRDVYDVRTGQTLSVDLFNVHGIVGGLNAAANDPNRFVEIPLRYER